MPASPLAETRPCFHLVNVCAEAAIENPSTRPKATVTSLNVFVIMMRSLYCASIDLLFVFWLILLRHLFFACCRVIRIVLECAHFGIHRNIAAPALTAPLA